MKKDKLDRTLRILREAEEKKIQNEGALEEVLRQIKSEFGCDSLEQAETLLETLQEENLNSIQELNRLEAKFEKKWKGVLDEFNL